MCTAPLPYLPVASVSLSEADAHFGFLGRVLAFDCPSSSTLTQACFDWHPEQPGLLADLDQGHYFTSQNGWLRRIEIVPHHLKTKACSPIISDR